ncbi:MAG: hypothetical protein H0W34_04500 [Pyrinomonadaceae bacterium]|nr:hypothetical protein [Pyrinomonadaceae bacterium]
MTYRSDRDSYGFDQALEDILPEFDEYEDEMDRFNGPRLFAPRHRRAAVRKFGDEPYGQLLCAVSGYPRRWYRWASQKWYGAPVHYLRS